MPTYAYVVGNPRDYWFISGFNDPKVKIYVIGQCDNIMLAGIN